MLVAFAAFRRAKAAGRAHNRSTGLSHIVARLVIAAAAAAMTSAAVVPARGSGAALTQPDAAAYETPHHRVDHLLPEPPDGGADTRSSLPPAQPGPAVADPPADSVSSGPRSLIESLEAALFERTNAERAAHGLPALASDVELLAIARTRAAGQVSLSALSHVDRSGDIVLGRLLANGGIPFQVAGENLARLTAPTPLAAALTIEGARLSVQPPEPRSTAATLRAPALVATDHALLAAHVAGRASSAFMNSASHRKNILEGRFTSVAVGAVADASGRVIYAQVFRAA